MKGGRQGVLLGIGLELLDEERGRDPAEFHGPDDPEQVIPALQNPQAIDAVHDLVG